MKCKVCKGTGIVAQLGIDGDYEPHPCDCVVKELILDEAGNVTEYYKELHTDES